jgi:hypothetical protein
MGLSDDPRKTTPAAPSKRVKYTGMVVDTFRRNPHHASRKSYVPGSLPRGRDLDVFNKGEASLFDLASLRGRVQHYSACLP